MVSLAGLQQAVTATPVVERCRAAELVLGYGGRGEEKKGVCGKEPLILDVVFIAVCIHAHGALLCSRCCELRSLCAWR